VMCLLLIKSSGSETPIRVPIDVLEQYACHPLHSWIGLERI
jgi:hypothetical protein